jgi:hypothetical protein
MYPAPPSPQRLAVVDSKSTAADPRRGNGEIAKACPMCLGEERVGADRVGRHNGSHQVMSCAPQRSGRIAVPTGPGDGAQLAVFQKRCPCRPAARRRQGRLSCRRCRSHPIRWRAETAAMGGGTLARPIPDDGVHAPRRYGRRPLLTRIPRHSWPAVRDAENRRLMRRC